ncbi:MAG: hypothetical protein ABW139_19730 [Candidatus Thiodiazotropha sp. DIVDIV]
MLLDTHQRQQGGCDDTRSHSSRIGKDTGRLGFHLDPRMYRGYAKRQKSSKANRGIKKQPTKIQPFENTKKSESAKGIDFELNDYLRLVDWTGRAIRNDKKARSPPILPQSSKVWA